MAKNFNNTKKLSRTSYLPEFTFGLKAYVLVFASTLAIQIFRGSNFTESYDKAIFMIAIVIAFSFLIYGINIKKDSMPSVVALVLFILSIILGIGGIEKHDPINGVILSNRLWLGFGPYVLLLALLITPVALRITEWKRLSPFYKFVLAALFTGNLALVLPSFWQSSATVIDPDHSEYVINELFGPLNGNWPYENYIPQYQTFYGFLLRPFIQSATAESASNTFLIFLTMLSYLTLALGIYFSWVGLQKRSIFLAIGLTIPFAGLTQFPHREGYLGSIAALLSGLSIRILPGFLLLAIAYVVTFKLKSKWNFAYLGIAGGLVAWQSQDFGIAATVALGLLILVSEESKKAVSIVKASIYAVGILIGLMIYPILGFIFGHKINLNYFLYFARQFGSGFGSEGMRTPGPVLYILPLIILLFVSHGLFAIRNRDNILIRKSSFIGFGMAAWSLLGFSYYLNRSYASGQMQVLFLPIAVSVASLVGVLMQLQDEGKLLKLDLKESVTSRALYRDKRAFSLLPISLIISVSLATLLLTPNPAVEFKRINEGALAPRWPKATITASVKDAATAASFARKNNLKIAFFGASSQYIQFETQVKSASILNSPFDLMMSQQTVQTSCEYIFKLNPDVLVVSDEGRQLFRFNNQTLCNKYKFADAPGVRQYHYAVRI